MMSPLLQVALGGSAGSVLRYLTGVALLRALGPGFPWGTLAVNVVGSAVMGVLAVTPAAKGWLSAAPFLTTCVVGGFTTFSAFALDSVSLWQRGDDGLGLLYVAASVILPSIPAFGVG